MKTLILITALVIAIACAACTDTNIPEDVAEFSADNPEVLVIYPRNK